MHFADLSPLHAVRLRAPKPTDVPGLRSAHAATAARLTKSPLPALQPGRVGLVAFWDDDASLDAFLAGHPTAAAMADGWRVRLEPLRAHGSWPGLDADVPKARRTDYDGPSAVMTLARTRWSRLPSFMRANAPAEAAVVDAPGKTWATAMARPPFFATFSLWESPAALQQYAYGNAPPGHNNAIVVDRAKPFHHQSAFIRFRPYDAHGRLSGKNPL